MRKNEKALYPFCPAKAKGYRAKCSLMNGITMTMYHTRPGNSIAWEAFYEQL